MKKHLLFLCALAFTMSAFVGCSDDDNPPLIPPVDLNSTFGIDENSQLTLNYGATPLVGKQVKFETSDSKTANLTLLDVIPGEAETVIRDIQLIEGQGEYIFSGNASMTRAIAGTIVYDGSVKKGTLTLNLTVMMPDVNGWAKTYGLAELVIGDLDYGAPSPRPNVPLAGALYISWSAPMTNGMDIGKANAVTFRGILGAILPQVIKSVTLQPDGNVGAEYSSDDVEFDMSMINSISAEKIAALVAKKSWQTSPKNLAFWFEKKDRLYVKLNIAAIIAQAMADQGQAGGSDALTSMILGLLNSGDVAQIKTLLSGLGISVSDKTLQTVLNWAVNGIPLNVEIKDGHTHLYFDKEDLDMLFSSPVSSTEDPMFYEKSDFAQILKALSSMIPSEYASMMGVVNQIPMQWPNTKEFMLGLDLITK